MGDTPQVLAIIVADAADGARIVSKYYGASPAGRAAFPSPGAQAAFEARLHKKTKPAAAKADAEVMLLDGLNVVYRSGVDVTFAVVGAADENELILAAILDALVAALGALLKAPLDKRAVMAQLELLLLTMDELVDGGVPLELDADAVAARVLLRGAVPDTISSYQEMTVGGMMDRARDKLIKNFVNK